MAEMRDDELKGQPTMIQEGSKVARSEKPAKWLFGTRTNRDLNPAYVTWLERRAAWLETAEPALADWVDWLRFYADHHEAKGAGSYPIAIVTAREIADLLDAVHEDTK